MRFRNVEGCLTEKCCHLSRQVRRCAARCLTAPTGLFADITKSQRWGVVAKAFCGFQEYGGFLGAGHDHVVVTFCFILKDFQLGTTVG